MTETATATEGYEVTALPAVTIAGRTFRAEEQHGPAMGTEGTVWLHGNRGAVYFLRGFLGADTGRYAVVSWRSGAELRDESGRAVRVVRFGDVIEDATVKPRPVH